MFFIFGWGNRKVKDFGPTIRQICKICSQQNHFNLIRTRDRIDVFFVPIIPYSTKYYLLCPHCQNASELEKDQVVKLKKIAQSNKDFEKNRITEEGLEDEYKKLFSKLE